MHVLRKTYADTMGSLRSVLALAGSALAFFCTVGFTNSYGVFQQVCSHHCIAFHGSASMFNGSHSENKADSLQYYTAHYLPTYTNFQISWIGSFAIFTFFACAPPVGLLADRYGPTTLILIGAIFEVVAIFMVSLCRDYYQFFLAQAVLLGASMSLIAMATSTVVPMYFKKNRGLAQGISIGGSSLGGVLWPIALDRMLNKDKISFGWTIRIVGFVMIPLLVLVFLFVRKPPIPKAEDSGPESGEKPKAKPKKDLTSLKQPPFILLCCGLALAYFGFFAPIFYVSIYATHLNFSENFAFFSCLTL
jgi:MFS family permease